MNDQGRLDYKLPGNKKVNLALFWATNSFGDKHTAGLNKAEAMLKEHGMGLNCWPSSRIKTPDRTFDFGPELIREEQYTDIYRTVSGVADGAGLREHLIVVFCSFVKRANGTTISRGPLLCFRRPMVFVSCSPGDDAVTLLHEVGHAAGMDHDLTSTGTTARNFMNEAETRSTMMKWQVEKMGQAFFIT
ncbi:MAG: hypothetical protein SGJ19_08315 [Planctomycetia bacterium]|nr:hypothetical protein [Planctomycetia bacterium]